MPEPACADGNPGRRALGRTLSRPGWHVRRRPRAASAPAPHRLPGGGKISRQQAEYVIRAAGKINEGSALGRGRVRDQAPLIRTSG